MDLLSKNGQNLTKEKNVSQQVKSYADAVKKDKPAGLAEMKFMASMYGIDIKIAEDPNYQLSQEDKAKGTQVIVFTQGSKNIEGYYSIGHFYLLGSNEKQVDIKINGEYDCGYAIFAQLTGKSVDTIRNEIAQAIEANSENFSKVLNAQAWLQENHPKEVNTLLFNGGCTKCHKIQVSIEDYLQANFDGKSIEVLKTTYKKIKDVTETVQTISLVVISASYLAIIVSGGSLAPICIPIIKLANIAQYGAAGIKCGNELYKQVCDSGVFSQEFLKQLNNQIIENSDNLLQICYQYGILDEHSKLAALIRFAKMDQNQQNLQRLKYGLRKLRNDKQFKSLIKTSKQLCGIVKSISILTELYDEQENILNLVQDFTKMKDVKKFQDQIDNLNITSQDQLNAIQQTIEKDGNFNFKYTISVKELTQQKNKLAEQNYGAIWAELNNKSKSIILAFEAKNKKLFNLSEAQKKYGNDINNAILLYDKEQNTVIPNYYIKKNKLAKQIYKVLNDPNGKHNFCQKEKKMLKNKQSNKKK
ncbi:hypothetical protein ABPG74_008329 [Tetrahymena malaccensis]